MGSATPKTLPVRACRTILLLAARLVPRDQRQDWLREWEAELEHSRDRLDGGPHPVTVAPWRLLPRCLGSFADAAWLLQRHVRDEILQDLRFGVRVLLRNPAFACVTILTIALGIGSNTAAFTMVHGLLLRPLPFGDPNRLVHIVESHPQSAEVRGVALADALDWRRDSRTLQSLAFFDDKSFTLSGVQEPEWIGGAEVSANFFSVLGVAPLLGRTFVPGEDAPGSAPIAVISHGLWKRALAADARRIGEELLLRGVPHRVVGVLPPRFRFPDNADIWLPLTRDPRRESRGNLACVVVARLGDGVSAEQARLELQALSSRLKMENGMEPGYTVHLSSLRQSLVRDFRHGVLLLWGAVAFLLLIAAANAAGLMLTRAATRQPEIAIRFTLGAARRRVVRQLLTESLLLALLGGGLGLAVGFAGKQLLVASLPGELPFWMRFDMDAPVLAFAALLSAATGLACGLAPAFHASRWRLEPILKAGTARGSAGRPQRRVRDLLVAGQVALALILSIGAGLMLQGFLKLRAVDPGVRPDGVLSLRLTLPAHTADHPQRQQALLERLLEQVATSPGVDRVAAASQLPLGGDRWDVEYSAESDRPAATGHVALAGHTVVTPGYFGVLGIPILQGRDFHSEDGRQGAAPVVIVNEALARLHWPRGQAVGRRIRYAIPGSAGRWLTVAGVAQDAHQSDLEALPKPAMYVPFGQVRVPSMALVLRHRSSAAALLPTLRARVRDVDPNLPIYQVLTMRELVDRALWGRRFFSWLLGIFAVLAVLLAMVGVYGVAARAAAARRHEIGIRLALGASRRDLVRMLAGQGLWLTACGLAVGAALALLLTRLLATLLYEVSPTDWKTFGGMALLLAATAWVACLLPAGRAASVDPMTTLRGE